MTRPTIVIQISPRQLWTAVVVLLLSVLMMVGVNILYTNFVDTQSNQVWCAVVNPLVARYKQLPNPDADAKEFLQAMSQVKRKYEC